MQGRIDPTGLLIQPHGKKRSMPSDWLGRPVCPLLPLLVRNPEERRTYVHGPPVSERLDCGSICVFRLV